MTRTVFFFAFLFSLVACKPFVTVGEVQKRSDGDLPKEQVPGPVVADDSTTADQETQFTMESTERGWVYFRDGTVMRGKMPETPLFEQGEFRACNGFLTRNIDEDFCSSQAPSDRVPFEFDGQTFYLQPLSANND